MASHRIAPVQKQSPQQRQPTKKINSSTAPTIEADNTPATLSSLLCTPVIFMAMFIIGFLASSAFFASSRMSTSITGRNNGEGLIEDGPDTLQTFPSSPETSFSLNLLELHESAVCKLTHLLPANRIPGLPIVHKQDKRDDLRKYTTYKEGVELSIQQVEAMNARTLALKRIREGVCQQQKPLELDKNFPTLIEVQRNTFMNALQSIDRKREILKRITAADLEGVGNSDETTSFALLSLLPELAKNNKIFLKIDAQPSRPSEESYQKLGGAAIQDHTYGLIIPLDILSGDTLTDAEEKKLFTSFFNPLLRSGKAVKTEENSRKLTRLFWKALGIENLKTGDNNNIRADVKAVIADSVKICDSYWDRDNLEQSGTHCTLTECFEDLQTRKTYWGGFDTITHISTLSWDVIGSAQQILPLEALRFLKKENKKVNKELKRFTKTVATTRPHLASFQIRPS